MSGAIVAGYFDRGKPILRWASKHLSHRQDAMCQYPRCQDYGSGSPGPVVLWSTQQE